MAFPKEELSREHILFYESTLDKNSDTLPKGVGC